MIDEADIEHANFVVHAVVTGHCCDKSLLAFFDLVIDTASET